LLWKLLLGSVLAFILIGTCRAALTLYPRPRHEHSCADADSSAKVPDWVVYSYNCDLRIRRA